MRRFAAAIVVLAVAAALIMLSLALPQRLDDDVLAQLGQGNAAAGERMFWAGGCASCHAGDKAEGEELLKLGGGHGLVTPFGTFFASNISTHPDQGIGNWSQADFANAMLRGISPDGSHYYPAFPYASYARMKPADIADLWAFMQTLPAVDTANRDHDLALPFRLRLGIGLWKRLHLSKAPVVAIDESDAQLVLGRYLAEGPAHCGECHTPRDLSGGLDTARWMSGAPAPEGRGRIPNITPHQDGVGDWTAADIAYALESGFTPEFDSFGSTMAKVVKNTAKLSADDRAAIASYVRALPAHPDG